MHSFDCSSGAGLGGGVLFSGSHAGMTASCSEELSGSVIMYSVVLSLEEIRLIYQMMGGEGTTLVVLEDWGLQFSKGVCTV